MEIKITEKFDNKLLHRKEVKGWISFAGATPSNEDVRLQVATALSADKALIIIDHIYNAYGAQEAKVFAKAYEKEEFLKKYEPQPKSKAKKDAQAEGEAPEGGEDAPPAKAAPADGTPAEAASAAEAPAPADDKPAEAKPGDKPADKKPADNKPAEEKPAKDKAEGAKE